MNIQPIRERLQEALSLSCLEVDTVLVDEHFVSLPPEALRAAVQVLLERKVSHLSTITGQDMDGQIELLYHFWDRGGLTFRVSLPREQTSIETIIDLIPGAAFYEREIAEMLGVTFLGHPEPQPLLLPEDWVGGPPLRHDFAWGEDREEGE